MLNLVENAVRYNRPGGEVRLTAAPYESGQIAIEVHDTGIGISTADRERIFERFYRGARSGAETAAAWGGEQLHHSPAAAEHDTGANHEEQENH